MDSFALWGVMRLYEKSVAGNGAIDLCLRCIRDLSEKPVAEDDAVLFMPRCI